ncbi:hypothetical protein ACFLYO_00180 [Chloroflexota bacterium]
MSKFDDSSESPEWLDEFEDLANEQLDDGSACAQVHPIVEQWLDGLLEGDPPDSRDAVWQAMSCLTTEILYKLTPDNVLDVVQQNLDEDEFSAWLESVVLVGRAFQLSLSNGELDDL